MVLTNDALVMTDPQWFAEFGIYIVANLSLMSCQYFFFHQSQQSSILPHRPNMMACNLTFAF